MERRGRFEIVSKKSGFAVELYDGVGRKILFTNVGSSKIMAQSGVSMIRSSCRVPDRFVQRRGGDGSVFAVLRGKNDVVIARTPDVAKESELNDLIAAVVSAARAAPIFDMTKRHVRTLTSRNESGQES
jgi:hypothetical protein